MHCVAGQRWIVRRWCIPGVCREPIRDASWKRDPVGIGKRHRLIPCHVVGHGRTGGHLCVIVAGNVRHNKAENARRGSRDGEASTLDPADLLSDRVHDSDWRAGGQKGLVQ